MDEYLATAPLIRIPIYMGVGIIIEFLFTAISDLISPYFLLSWNTHQTEVSHELPPWRRKKDFRFVGYSFLWMIPIYGLLIFLEPIYLFATSPLHWIIRGTIYMLLIFIVEYFSGWLIKKIIGICPWDYNPSRFSIHGYIRIDFIPIWFAFGLFIEYLIPRLIKLTPHLQNIF